MLDADKLSEDEQLGAVTLALAEVEEGGAQEAWHDLDRAGARLRLRTRWLAARPAPAPGQQGGGGARVVSVYVGRLQLLQHTAGDTRELCLEVATERDTKSSKSVQENNKAALQNKSEHIYSLVLTHVINIKCILLHKYFYFVHMNLF